VTYFRFLPPFFGAGLAGGGLLAFGAGFIADFGGDFLAMRVNVAQVARDGKPRDERRPPLRGRKAVSAAEGPLAAPPGNCPDGLQFDNYTNKAGAHDCMFLRNKDCDVFNGIIVGHST
jgi:hypothetical protein